MMRIHILDDAAGRGLPVTAENWQAALAEHGAGIGPHEVSFGPDWESVCAEVEAVVAASTFITRADFFKAPRLRLIQSTFAGVDRLSPFSAIPEGVALCNNRGVHTKRAGEYAAMAILALTCGLPGFMDDQRARRWNQRTSGLAASRRLTIVGLGGLGTGALAWAKALGMRVTGVTRSGAPHADCARVVPTGALDEVLGETDILLLACPLTPQTHHLLSAARIGRLPKGAGVINIGRGGLVDQAALIAALHAGHLGGAVLDVFAQEPIPAGDPVWDAPNLIITPHMSCDDPARYNIDTLHIFFANLAALAAGQTPPTLVDRRQGY